MKLTAAIRRNSAASMFGLPALKKYYLGDRAHQINAKARATQQLAKGNLTQAQDDEIQSKANRLLKKHGS